MMTVTPVEQVPNKIQQGTVVFLKFCSVIKIVKVGHHVKFHQSWNHESPRPKTTKYPMTP